MQTRLIQECDVMLMKIHFCKYNVRCINFLYRRNPQNFDFYRIRLRSFLKCFLKNLIFFVDAIFDVVRSPLWTCSILDERTSLRFGDFPVTQVRLSQKVHQFQNFIPFLTADHVATRWWANFEVNLKFEKKNLVSKFFYSFMLCC